MGAASGCLSSAGNVNSLIKKYQPQLLEYFVGTEGKTKTQGIFNQIKEQVTNKFNKLPNTSQNNEKFDQIIGKIDNDQDKELKGFDAMTDKLKQIKGLDKLPKDKQQGLLETAKAKLGPQITQKLNSVISGLKSKFTVAKYLGNFM